VLVECVFHRATTGVADPELAAFRTGFGAGRLKPQNIIAIPTNSPTYTSDVSPARDRPVAAATHSAPDAIHAFARMR